METKVALHLRPIIILVTLLCVTFAPVDFQPSAAVAAYGYTWTDEFDSSFLHPLWSWVREDASHWNLSAAPGSLRIITQEGGIFMNLQDNQKNLLVADAPAGNFQISTKVTINTTTNFQYAGIQVYQDDDNYIQLNWAYANGTKINLDKEIGGTVTETQIPAPAVSTLFLRIEKIGNVYSGYTSTNGSTWSLVGQHTASLSNPKISLAAANGGSGVAEIPADFDWFKLEANFANFRYTNTDNFNSSILDSRWTWMNENPSTWSLTANPGYLRILTDNGYVSGENLLYQPVPCGDFSITTYQDFTPTSNYQIASLVLFQDSQNIMQLGRAFCSSAPPACTSGNGIYYDFINAGNYAGNFPTGVPEVGEAYLKIERRGSTYSGYYIGDGASWQLTGRHKPTGPFIPILIGLTAAQDFSDLKTPADFDFFEESHNDCVFLPLLRK